MRVVLVPIAAADFYEGATVKLQLVADGLDDPVFVGLRIDLESMSCWIAGHRSTQLAAQLRHLASELKLQMRVGRRGHGFRPPI